MLKNKNHLLPLDKQKIKKIAVIGQRATEVLQDWYSGKPFYTVNVLDAIREEAGNDIEVRYVATNRMDSARTVAAWADVAIVCVGNHPTCNAGWEQAPVVSEGKEAVDRQSIQLDQEDLLLQVAQANPNTIGVLISSFRMPSTAPTNEFRPCFILRNVVKNWDMLSAMCSSVIIIRQAD